MPKKATSETEDVQALRKEIATLRDTAERYRALIDNLPIGVYRNTPGAEGKFLDVNKTLVEMAEAGTKENFLKHTVSEVYQDPRQRAAFAERLLREGSVKNVEIEFHTFTGKKIIGSVSAIVQKDSEGNVYFDGVVEDVTEHKHMETMLKRLYADLEHRVAERTRALEESNERLTDTKRALLSVLEDLQHEKTLAEQERARDDAILDSIGVGLVVTNKEGKITMVSKSFFDLLGWSREEVVGKSLADLVPIQDENGVLIAPQDRYVSRILRGEKLTTPVVTNRNFIRKNGTSMPVSLVVAPVISSEGLLGVVETFFDTTKEKELERAKNEFLSLASHQLRTPLSATKWVLDLFKQDENLTEKHKERLNDLYVSNERLIALVGGLLHVTKIEAGTVVTKKERIDVCSFVRDTCDLVQSAIHKKNQKLNIIATIPSMFTFADRVLLGEVLTNLLDNATVYAPVNSEIEVVIDVFDEKTYVISVHNSGSYIPEADHEHLFTKFYRGVRSSKVVGAGSGLGLYIAKSAVEANGGKIWFESSLDKGTTFYFTVPRTL